MPHNVKLFEWLVYGAGGLDVLTTLFQRNPWSEIVVSVVFWLIMAAAAWAAARHGQRWAAWIVLALAVLCTALSIASWAVPEFPETPLTTVDTVSEIISIALIIVALYLYFFGARKPA